MTEFKNWKDVAEHYGYGDYCKKEAEERISRDFYKNTDCGAWFRFNVSKGIVIGTIVEGADCDGPSTLLMYPFTEEQIDSALEEIESAASEMWYEWNEH